ncbi:Dephospho-CoA kinase (Dephosphocoenzyme A kinase) (COAE) [Coemansia sp. 'formosensis']|uniref:Dephospho-CoA kinase (Dephosphocoenzyme A kinase) (COAE) n=1 Tax=Coemansia furcata TaxID=417177 RepID=A0ACC1KRV8_9FUNG|nr:Dephospho-CoA kinase (Dephosphocoenzyme A kinase) (COAE) [Coemansia furcata]KAJ2829467.1 Dephospho-CoA kinase (Dephosphocoenzyme A kinase) (COAE) [Coemansia sp. 'formosensis']
MPSCDGIREEFIRCMLRSECVFIKRHSVAECVTNKELESLVPNHCHLLRQSLFDCKRGLIDMRRRMRGVPNAGVKLPQKHEDSSKWDS